MNLLLNTNNKKPKDPEVERQGALIFGKHVSKEKGIVLLVLSVVVCAMPILLGLRIWDAIPEMYDTGFVSPGGKADIHPRALVVFGWAGLAVLLNIITHVQLGYNQKNMTLPPAHIRLMGRWGFPLVSLLGCPAIMHKAAGLPAMQPQIVVPALLGAALLILGSYMYDCKYNSAISLRFVFSNASESSWNAIHRMAAWCWLAAGFVLALMAMVANNAMTVSLVVFAAALVLPVVVGKARRM